MDSITRIWVYLAETPLLWLAVTLIVFWLAQRLYRLTGDFALLNPVLISVTALVLVLRATGTPYHAYFDDAQFIHFLLGPAKVALAVPLAAQAKELRRLWFPITVAIGVAAHGIGTARAFEHSERAGVFSGLAMGLNGALTAILVPLLVWLLGF